MNSTIEERIRALERTIKHLIWENDELKRRVDQALGLMTQAIASKGN